MAQRAIPDFSRERNNCILFGSYAQRDLGSQIPSSVWESGAKRGKRFCVTENERLAPRSQTLFGN